MILYFYSFWNQSLFFFLFLAFGQIWYADGTRYHGPCLAGVRFWVYPSKKVSRTPKKVKNHKRVKKNCCAVFSVFSVLFFFRSFCCPFRKTQRNETVTKRGPKSPRVLPRRCRMVTVSCGKERPGTDRKKITETFNRKSRKLWKSKKKQGKTTFTKKKIRNFSYFQFLKFRNWIEQMWEKHLLKFVNFLLYSILTSKSFASPCAAKALCFEGYFERGLRALTGKVTLRNGTKLGFHRNISETSAVKEPWSMSPCRKETQKKKSTANICKSTSCLAEFWISETLRSLSKIHPTSTLDPDKVWSMRVSFHEMAGAAHSWGTMSRIEVVLRHGWARNIEFQNVSEVSRVTVLMTSTAPFLAKVPGLKKEYDVSPFLYTVAQDHQYRPIRQTFKNKHIYTIVHPSHVTYTDITNFAQSPWPQPSSLLTIHLACLWAWRHIKAMSCQLINPTFALPDHRFLRQAWLECSNNLNAWRCVILRIVKFGESWHVTHVQVSPCLHVPWWTNSRCRWSHSVSLCWISCVSDLQENSENSANALALSWRTSQVLTFWWSWAKAVGLIVTPLDVAKVRIHEHPWASSMNRYVHDKWY